MVDELRMVASKKLSDDNHESLESLESEYDKNNIYQVENMSLDETKETI